MPYLTHGDNGSLEYWEYDKLGTTASAGCVRLTVADAKWIYNNCAKGTKVEFYADSNPGPLGKPTAQKISSEEQVRGWDPTDPDPANPWKAYTKKEETTKVENTIKVPSNTVGTENTVNNTIKPENTITSGGTSNTVKPENTITSGGTSNTVKPANTVTSGGTSNTVKPANTVTSGGTSNTVKPANTVTSGEKTGNTIKSENII